MDVEYLSLHGYIRNTPSDTEVHAKQQLRAISRKNIQNHAKLSRMKELGGKTGVSVGLDLPSAGGGTDPPGVEAPRWGNCLSQRRLRGKQLICGTLNGSDSSCHSHTYPGQGRRSPVRQRGWELEFRDCETIRG